MSVPRRLRLDHARILTCDDLSVIDDGCLVVEHDQIAWVGSANSLPPMFSTVDEVVDVAGATVMPGLVDAHMHISFGEAASEEELSIHTPIAFRAIRASVDARKVLDAGVTSACDPGGPRGIATAVRDAINAGLVIGPRMSAAGRQITTQQGVGDTLPAPLGELTTSFGALVHGVDQIVQEIRDEVKDRVDLIKIAGSGPETTEHGAFTLDELNVAVGEAHRLGCPIAIHARSRQAIADAVAAGFDWIMHASYMDFATLEQLIEKQIPIIPAMTLLVNSIEAGDGVLPSVIVDAIKRELDAATEILTKARIEGATLIAGSETGFAMTPYGQWHTREMELFVDRLGFSNHEALLSMTKYATRAMPRIGERIGTLTPGKYADLLVIDGKPDRDVKLFADKRRILRVMKGGQFITRMAPSSSRQPELFERTRLYVHSVYNRQQLTKDSGSR